MTVHDAFDYFASGMTYHEILDKFPYLHEEGILTCLSYVADQRVQFRPPVAIRCANLRANALAMRPGPSITGIEAS